MSDNQSLEITPRHTLSKDIIWPPSISSLADIENPQLPLAIADIRELMRHYGRALFAEAVAIANNPDDNINDKPIEDMGFSHRTYSCLKRAKIDTLHALIWCDYGRLRKALKWRTAPGKKSFVEVCAKLAFNGFPIKAMKLQHEDREWTEYLAGSESTQKTTPEVP